MISSIRWAQNGPLYFANNERTVKKSFTENTEALCARTCLLKSQIKEAFAANRRSPS